MSSHFKQFAQQLGLFAEHPTVEVVRSPRRRKTVQMTQHDGVMRIVVPEHISRREEKHWVNEMLKVVEAKTLSSDDELRDRAEKLAYRYNLKIPASINWVQDRKTRWAHCEIDTQEIGIGEQIKTFPSWVIDYIIVHELAHLTERRHNKVFWSLVHRYPKTERARGYLDAKAEATGATEF